MATWIVNLFEKKSATEKDTYLIPYSMIANTPTIPDVSGKANLDGGNTFTGKQTLNNPASDGYSINAAGYVKGSWLQATSTGKAGSNTGKVCVLDGSGWVYYRTPAEIVSDGGGVTQVKINGTTKSPDSTGLVDLGTVGGGGGSSDNSKHGYTELTNEDLNTITEVGWYRAANGNSCTNRPTTSTTAFILVVEKSTTNYVRQTFYFVASTEEFYNRFSINGGSTWKTWITQTTLTNETQNISGYKSFLRGINVVNELALNGKSGSNGQFAMSRGSNKSATWVNIQVKVNGTTYTADNSGLIDLGTISGGGSASTSQYNDIY